MKSSGTVLLGQYIFFDIDKILGPGKLAEAQGDEVIEQPLAAPLMLKAGSPTAQAEALSALGNLGYAPGDAASAVAQAGADMPEADTSGLIRAALKLLAPKG